MAPGAERNNLLKSFLVDEFVHLKIGASVILAKNLPDFHELANGSIGTVSDFRRVEDVLLGDGVLISRCAQPLGLWPVVDFPCRSGTVYRVLILQETYSVEGNRGAILVSRKQVSFCFLTLDCILISRNEHRYPWF